MLQASAILLSSKSAAIFARDRWQEVGFSPAIDRSLLARFRLTIKIVGTTSRLPTRGLFCTSKRGVGFAFSNVRLIWLGRATAFKTVTARDQHVEVDPGSVDRSEDYRVRDPLLAW